MAKNQDFGKFMSALAQKASPATADMLVAIQDKIRKEKEAELERKLMGVWAEVQREVANLRQVRRVEKATLARIEALEKRANDMIEGKED